MDASSQSKLRFEMVTSANVYSDAARDSTDLESRYLLPYHDARTKCSWPLPDIAKS